MKLHQLLAIEKDIKVREHKKLTDLYHIAKKPSFFAGFTRTFRPSVDDGETLPAERQIVQQRADELLKQGLDAFAAMINAAGSKDVSNLSAIADVVVDDVVVMSGVPATHLLHLEKALIELRSFISELPELDPAEEWIEDQGNRLFRTALTSQGRTKKVQKPLVLFPATDKHPAQTQLITEDIIVGFWDTVKFSGGISLVEKFNLLNKLTKLMDAVKVAREAANGVEADGLHYGTAIKHYMLA